MGGLTKQDLQFPVRGRSMESSCALPTKMLWLARILIPCESLMWLGHSVVDVWTSFSLRTPQKWIGWSIDDSLASTICIATDILWESLGHFEPLLRYQTFHALLPPCPLESSLSLLEIQTTFHHIRSLGNVSSVPWYHTTSVVVLAGSAAIAEASWSPINLLPWALLPLDAIWKLQFVHLKAARAQMPKWAISGNLFPTPAVGIERAGVDL